MRHVRNLAILASLVALQNAVGQDAAASQPTTRPAAETSPTSRPAEVRVRHPRIGIRVDSIALERQKIARVEAVAPGSPAERAGIRVGDVIVKVGGDEIRDDKSYRDVLSRRRPGDSVTMTLRRGGEEMDVAVILVDKLARTEPDDVTVQHVLVMCGDRPNPQGKKRTVEDAKKLADEILLKARNGADFSELAKTYSEDPGSLKNDPVGSYVLANDGKPKPVPAAHDRKDFLAGFTAVAFSLDIGDVAMSPYDPELSSYGFHIIKRVK